LLAKTAPPDHALRWNGFYLLYGEDIPAPEPCYGFCPTSFLARNLQVRAGERVLDLTTGSGLVALEAAKRDAQVTAIDWHKAALSSLRRNALMAGFDEPEIRQGEGLETNSSEHYDLITWAAPFLKGTPRNPSERRILRGPDLPFVEMLRGALASLRRGGRLLVPFPDRDDASWLHAQLDSAGFRFSPIVLQVFPLVGKVRLYQAWSPAPGSSSGLVHPGEALPGTGWLLRNR